MAQRTPVQNLFIQACECKVLRGIRFIPTSGLLDSQELVDTLKSTKEPHELEQINVYSTVALAAFCICCMGLAYTPRLQQVSGFPF